jgi:hypothetical protein
MTGLSCSGLAIGALRMANELMVDWGNPRAYGHGPFSQCQAPQASISRYANSQSHICLPESSE